MAFRYSMVFRDKVCRRLRDGERVENLAHELVVAAQTLFRWKRQALIDSGEFPYTSSAVHTRHVVSPLPSRIGAEWQRGTSS